MFFKLNQSKEFQRAELCYAVFNALFTALVSTTLFYCIADLIIIKVAPEIDVIDNVPYMFIIAVTFALIFSICILFYFRTKKGVEIRENEIIFSVGYFAKGIPINFPKNYGRLSLDDIKAIDFMESYSLRELKKDYKNYNYVWYYFGIRSKNIPVAQLTVAQKGTTFMYLFPLDDVEGFINEIKNKKGN